MSISKDKLIYFIDFAIECNLKEAKEAKEYQPPPSYWLGRAEALRNIKRRLETGEFDE